MLSFFHVLICQNFSWLSPYWAGRVGHWSFGSIPTLYRGHGALCLNPAGLAYRSVELGVTVLVISVVFVAAAVAIIKFATPAVAVTQPPEKGN